MKMNRKQKLFGAIAGVAMVGTVGVAFTTGLGGLGVQKQGTESAVIAACDTDGVALMETYDFSANGTPVITGYTLNSLDAACNGQNFHITAYNGSGTNVGEAWGTLAVSGGSSGFLTLGTSGSPGTPIPVADYSKVNVLIYGW